MIGPGIYTEQIQLVNRNIRLIGSGVDHEAAGNGTVLKLPDATNDNLIEHTAAFTDYPHAVHIANMTLDGNSANNTSGSCLYLRNGGFNTIIENVHLKDAENYGIDFGSIPVTCLLHNITGPLGSGTNMDAVFRITMSSGDDNGYLRVWGFECDDIPYVFDVSDGSTGNTNILDIRGVKWENATNTSTAFLRHTKTVEGDSLRISLDGLSYANYGAGGNMNAIFDLNHSGGPYSSWTETYLSMRNIVAPEADNLVDDNINTTTEAWTASKGFRGGTYITGIWSAF